jgi:hypothetical protein
MKEERIIQLLIALDFSVDLLSLYEDDEKKGTPFVG